MLSLYYLSNNMTIWNESNLRLLVKLIFVVSIYSSFSSPSNWYVPGMKELKQWFVIFALSYPISTSLLHSNLYSSVKSWKKVPWYYFCEQCGDRTRMMQLNWTFTSLFFAARTLRSFGSRFGIRVLINTDGFSPRPLHWGCWSWSCQWVWWRLKICSGCLFRDGEDELLVQSWVTSW